jgi:putative spermidine/putrescine transport system permease protein
VNELRAALPRLRIPLVILGAVIAAFLLAPLLVILPTAFSSGRFLRFPPPGLSTEWFPAVLSDPLWTEAILTSLWVATIAAVVATVAGALAAFAVRRLRRGTRVLRTILLAPLVIPPLVLALGLYLVFSNVGDGVDLRTLALGQATLAMPLVFVTMSAGLASVDPALSRAASGLGYSWPWIVWRVELPLVKRSLASSAILAFALCFDEAVLAYFLSPPGQETLPTRFWLSASESASPAIAAVSTLVIGVAVALLAVVAFLGREGKER